MENHEIDFGFETIPTVEKTDRVRGVFDSVASNYDIMNDVMSGGLHRLWKNHFIKQIPLRDNLKLLDLAGGTGDISFRYAELAHKSGCQVKTIISDINGAMLEEGKKRAHNNHQSHFAEIEWLEANAESLPIESNSVDAVTIAFGIRNVTHRAKALAEIYRVLKPGSPFLCLEFSRVKPAFLRKIYNEYSFHVIPQLGKIIAKDKASYQYLVESIQRFPDAPEFADELKDSGFERVGFERLTQGVVAIHKGWKI